MTLDCIPKIVDKQTPVAKEIKLKMSCVVQGCQFTKNTNEKVSMHLFPDPMREPQRHLNWIKVINCERIFKFDPYVVFKRFRVCRNHFASDCFNGQCKKLLPTAVPSLYLSTSNPDRLKTKYQMYEQKIINLLKNNSVNVEDDTLKLINIDESQLKLPDNEIKISIDEKLWNNADEEHENEEFVLMEVVNDSLEEENQSFTIVLPPETTPNPPKVLNYQKSGVKTRKNDKTPKVTSLTKTKLKNYQASFIKCPKNILAQNICTKSNPYEVLSNNYNESDFTHKIDLKIANNTEKEFWCDTSFNLIRLPLIKQFNIEEFEFSQAHFCYWDTIERSYWFLSNIVETNEENIDSQLLITLLDNPLNEGKENWKMFTNIINKHGLMPKKCFSKNTNSQPMMNEILKAKLREFAKILRDMLSSKRSNSEVQIKIDEQMCEVYSIVSILFGSVPEKFTWEYFDRSGKFYTIGPITPLEFFEQYVKPLTNADSKIMVSSHSTLEYEKIYCANFLGNTVGGQPTQFYNQPMEILIDLIMKSIMKEEPVIANCFVNGIHDFQLQNFKHLCDIKILSSLEKSDRIAYRDLSQKQMMIVSGVEVDRYGKLQKIRLESVTSQYGSRFLTIPKEHIQKVISEIVVDKKFLSDESIGEQIILEPIDALSL